MYSTVYAPLQSPYRNIALKVRPQTQSVLLYLMV